MTFGLPGLLEQLSLSRDDIISHWLKNVHGVDDQFAQAVWELYFEKLVRLARNKLGDLPRRDEDEEDAALGAIESFLQGAREGRFPLLSDSDDLWKLLVTITARKVTARRRRFFAEKRGSGRVRGESVFWDDQEGLSSINQVLGREPTEQLAEGVVATSDELLAKLTDSQLKAIALFKMESYTNDEIAKLMGCSLRTVNRRLKEIRILWANESSDSDSEEE